MEWQQAVIVILGVIGQHLKAFKNIPTSAVQAILLLLGVGCFALQNPPSQPLTSWVISAIMWGFAVIGVASGSASIGVAPKTDSR